MWYFYETVWFLGRLSHSLTGSGFCLFSAKHKMFLFCRSLDTYFIHFFVITPTSVLKTSSAWGQSGKVQTAIGKD